MKETHKCSSNKGGHNIMGALLRHSFPDAMKCGKNAKYFENDRWYCGIHAPSKIKEREERNFNRLRERIARDLQRRTEYKEKAERIRK